MIGANKGVGVASHTAPMSEINTTPLVDVMLVLLVIFIITAPLLTHAVKIDLPQASSQPLPEKPEAATRSIDRSRPAGAVCAAAARPVGARASGCL